MPILAILELAVQLLPELQGLVALVNKAIAGVALNDADLAKLQLITNALNARIADAANKNQSA